MRFAFIDAERAESARIPLFIYCRVLEVSCAGYWSWKSRPPSARAQTDEAVGTRIETLFEASG